MKAFLILVVTALACSSPAEMLIYKQKVSYTRTGGGSVLKGSLTGWLVLDGDSGEVVFIDASAKRLRYTVTYWEYYSIEPLAGSSGRPMTLLSSAGSHTDDNGHWNLFSFSAKGNNLSLTPLTKTYSMPKSLSGTYTWIFPNSSGALHVEEAKGKWTYDPGLSQVTSTVYPDLDDTVDYLASLLTQKGYLEE